MTWEPAFDAREGLGSDSGNALAVFAIGLRYPVEDLVSAAAQSITDGSDDKKCDVVFIDAEEGYAVVAQAYYSDRERTEAPANKAADLNTAASWLLQRPLEELPERIRSHADGLRDAIRSGEVTTLRFWYVHNLPESQNVGNELRTVEATATAAVAAAFPGREVAVSAKEVGSSQLEEWYVDSLSPILVADEIDFHVEGGFEQPSSEWTAYVTAIPATRLFDLYRQYGKRLFSANVRDYLGSRRSDANINNGIKQTALRAPADFWAYNNGLTILVNDYAITTGDDGVQLRLRGMSIVNGAQTTGAVGSLDDPPAPEARIPARFIKTGNTEIIQNIVQFNNSQNRVSAADFRSNDRIQRRLREEFERLPDATYQGGRRGGTADAIKRQRHQIPSLTAGQAIAACHGHPEIAYHKKSDLWADDRVYGRFFNDEITAEHLVYAYALLRAVEAQKTRLVEKSRRSEALTESEQGQLEFFRHRGSIHLLVAAIGGCIEIFLDEAVPNRFRLSFGATTSAVAAEERWAPVVSIAAQFCSHLLSALQHGIRSQEHVREPIGTFRSLVGATAGANREVFRVFAESVSRTAAPAHAAAPAAVAIAEAPATARPRRR